MENLELIITKSYGWTLRNLKEHKNTVIPRILAEGRLVHGDLTILEKELEKLHGKKIKIRKIVEKVETIHPRDKNSVDIFYIAEESTLSK